MSKQTDWTDVVLHYVMGMVFGGIMLMIEQSFSAASIMSAFAIVWREFVQADVLDDGGSSFGSGWDFWNWGHQKTIETWPPALACVITWTALEVIL